MTIAGSPLSGEDLPAITNDFLFHLLWSREKIWEEEEIVCDQPPPTLDVGATHGTSVGGWLVGDPEAGGKGRQSITSFDIGA